MGIRNRGEYFEEQSITKKCPLCRKKFSDGKDKNGNPNYISCKQLETIKRVETEDILKLNKGGKRKKSRKSMKRRKSTKRRKSIKRRK